MSSSPPRSLPRYSKSIPETPPKTLLQQHVEENNQGRRPPSNHITRASIASTQQSGTCFRKSQRTTLVPSRLRIPGRFFIKRSPRRAAWHKHLEAKRAKCPSLSNRVVQYIIANNLRGAHCSRSSARKGTRKAIRPPCPLYFFHSICWHHSPLVLSERPIESKSSSATPDGRDGHRTLIIESGEGLDFATNASSV